MTYQPPSTWNTWIAGFLFGFTTAGLIFAWVVIGK